MNEGESAYKIAETIYPIYRSITGNGVRQTLEIIDKFLGQGQLILHEIPTGRKCFDWEIPKEWELYGAYIEYEDGERVLDFQNNCLHVVGYSLPVDKWVSYDELMSIIYTQPDQPDVIPYVTSYYNEIYGFCMSEKKKRSLRRGNYHIHIDSKLFDGSLTYGEVLLGEECQKEILISTYICHPSMGNDNCSGIALATQLIRYVKSITNRHYSYRFVFVPETIGTIAFLSEGNNLSNLQNNCVGGFTLSCVGDDGEYSYVKSKNGNSLSDRVIRNVLQLSHIPKNKIKEYSFLERGSDERQYNSPGVGLSIVGFCRTKYWEFPQYHTSLDNIHFINPRGLQGSFDIMKKVIDALEHNAFYKTITICEPQLGKRGLYSTVSQKNTYNNFQAVFNFLAYADGEHDLIEISDTIKEPIDTLIPIINRLLEEGLIEKKEEKWK